MTGPWSDLTLKLVLTPILITVASLASRRFGHALGGWLVGLPFTSGPIVWFVALDHGRSFAAATAEGTLAATVAQVGFAVVYIRLAMKRRWGPSLGGATLSFLFLAAVLLPLSHNLSATAALVVASLVVGLVVSRGAERAPTREPAAPPRWDIPVRAGVTTAFVLVLTALAALLGPRLTGLLAPFPLYGSTLATFAHRHYGSPAGIQVLRGLLRGLFATCAFFAALALLVDHVSVGVAFFVAAATALTAQAVSLWSMRRGPRTADAPSSPIPRGD